MSQNSVELVIGRLVTDEGFLRRYAASPGAALDQLEESGLRLNPCERRALAGLDVEALRRFAQQLDPRILKCDLHAPPAPGGAQQAEL